MKKILFLFTFILSLLLISCSNAAGEPLYINGNDTKDVTIIVSSQDTQFNFPTSKSERSITPGALSGNDMDFYLEGTNKSTGTTIPNTKVEFTAYEGSTDTGSVTLDLTPGIYELTLYVCKKGQTLSSDTMYLRGRTVADLFTENKVYFALSSNSLNATTGEANFYIYTQGWQVTNDMTVTAGIYILDNENSKVSEVQNFNLKNHHYNSPSEVPANITYNYKSENVVIGTGVYNLIVKINSNGVNYYYSDTVFIEPNRPTYGIVAIPNIVSKIPEGPDYLIARYKEPENATEAFYPVEFCWNDNSVTESNFQLELLCIDSEIFNSKTASIEKVLSTTETTENKKNYWNSIKSEISEKDSNNIIILDEEFYDYEEISKYLEGSLTANSKYCVYNLLAGKSYLARICACSSAGNSEYVYLDLLNSQGKTFETTKNITGLNIWTVSDKAMYAEPFTYSAEEKAILEKYALVNEKNVFVYSSDSATLNTTIIENNISLNQYNKFTVSKTTANKYLIFTLKNIFANKDDNTGMGIKDEVFDSITFSIYEQGSIPFISATATEDKTLTSDIDTAHYRYYAIDLTDTEKFQTGKTYNVEYKAKAGTHEISTIVIFDFVE